MTWILVAHPKGARLFEHRRDLGLWEIDLSGRLAPPHAAGADDPANPAARTELMRYTLELAELLEVGVRDIQVDALVLLADKSLLGTIRRHLSATTAQRIRASFNEARIDWDVASVEAKLAPLLGLPRSAEADAEFF